MNQDIWGGCDVGVSSTRHSETKELGWFIHPSLHTQLNIAPDEKTVSSMRSRSVSCLAGLWHREGTLRSHWLNQWASLLLALHYVSYLFIHSTNMLIFHVPATCPGSEGGGLSRRPLPSLQPVSLAMAGSVYRCGRGYRENRIRWRFWYFPDWKIQLSKISFFIVPRGRTSLHFHYCGF